MADFGFAYRLIIHPNEPNISVYDCDNMYVITYTDAHYTPIIFMTTFVNVSIMYLPGEKKTQSSVESSDAVKTTCNIINQCPATVKLIRRLLIIHPSS